MTNRPLTQNSHNDTPSGPIDEALKRFGPRWITLSRVRIGTPPDGIVLDHILIHPSCGVALIDRVRRPAVVAVETMSVELFRKFLKSGEFETFFPGYLPVVRVAVGMDNLAELSDALANGFAAVPLLTINDGAWADALATVLGTAPPPHNLATPGTADDDRAAARRGDVTAFARVARAEGGDPERAADITPSRSDALHADPASKPERVGNRRGPIIWAAGCLVLVGVVAAAISMPQNEPANGDAAVDHSAHVALRSDEQADPIDMSTGINASASSHDPSTTPLAADTVLPDHREMPLQSLAAIPSPAKSGAIDASTAAPSHDTTDISDRSAISPLTATNAAQEVGAVPSPPARRLRSKPQRHAPLRDDIKKPRHAELRVPPQASRLASRGDGPPIDAADLPPPDMPPDHAPEQNGQ